MRLNNNAYLLFVIAALTFAALACGSDDSSGLEYDTFAQVCQGEGVEHDTHYGSAAGGAGPFPVLVFRQTDDDQSWLRISESDLGEEFPADWHPARSKLTELVVCLTVVERDVTAECTYAATGKKNKGEELTIQLNNTTYEAILRNAQTAREYDTTTFTAMAEQGCPETAGEAWDQDTRMIDANPAEELVPFLTPWTEE